MEIIKKVLKSICYCCSGKGVEKIKKAIISKKKCKTCKGTGIYKENYYYHIVGNQCFEGDTIK